MNADEIPEETYERIIARLTSAPQIYIPARAHLDPRMTPALMRVFLSMCWHLNGDYECWPGQDLLAAELGITKQAVSKSIAQLITLGYVEIARKGFRGVGQNNTYRVIFQRNSENTAGKSDGNSGKSENARKSSTAPARQNPHSQPDVDSIVNLTLTHSQPEVVQKYNNEDKQLKSVASVSFNSTSLAQSAETAAETPATPAAPPERRTRESVFDPSALKRDPLYIALAQYIPEPLTYDDWREWAVSISRLHRAGASASEIPNAIKGHRLLMPTAFMTPRSIAKWWSQIREGKDREQLQRTQLQRAKQQARQAHDPERETRRERERAAIAELERELGIQ